MSERPEGVFTNAVRLPCAGSILQFLWMRTEGHIITGVQLFASGVMLDEDMVSFAPETVVENIVTEEEHYSHEESSMRKIGDTYYYICADMERGKPPALGYAIKISAGVICLPENYYR